MNKMEQLRGKSLIDTHPKLIDEWNFEKNIDIQPEEVMAGSGKKVWWKCSEGHSWQAQIRSRTLQGQGCPYCSGRKAIKGENDLATTHPKLLEEWNYEKNEIQPTEVKAGSHNKVYWKCKEEHEWQATINSRIHGNGCPYCSGNKIRKGYNDLATMNPELLEEWNYERNEIKPTEVMACSNKKVWWKCSKGHEWQSFINNRTQGSGCPYCSGKKAIKGVNDLGTTHSKLVEEEWNYEKNEIRPEEVTAGSNKKVWWRCKKGHEWQAQINSRTSGKGCPYCSNRKIKVGYNDLATTHPEMLEEWDYEKNEIRPEEVMAGSKKKVWWRCKKGHSWQSFIYNRTRGFGCPYCSERKKGSKKNE